MNYFNVTNFQLPEIRALLTKARKSLGTLYNIAWLIFSGHERQPKSRCLWVKIYVLLASNIPGHRMQNCKEICSHCFCRFFQSCYSNANTSLHLAYKGIIMTLSEFQITETTCNTVLRLYSSLLRVPCQFCIVTAHTLREKPIRSDHLVTSDKIRNSPLRDMPGFRTVKCCRLPT